MAGISSRGRKAKRGTTAAQFYHDTEFSSVEEPNRISLGMFTRVVERLCNDDIQDSTKKMYHSIWCNFNKFLLSFDDLPTTWEDKMVLYASFLADIGNHSATVSSYMSAIRYVLRHDGIEISNTSCKLSSIIRACKLQNDVVTVRRPIRSGLLRLILDQVNAIYLKKGQPYLAALYRAVFVSAYYGLMRISELVGRHAVKTEDVHISTNPTKLKVKYVLRSSKTHTAGRRPQLIDIQPDYQVHKTPNCPVLIINQFAKLRPPRVNIGTRFFVFSDGTPVGEHHVRTTLRNCLKRLNLPWKSFNFHGYRSGRATDLFKWNFDIDWIRKIGRWSRKSTAILAYFK